ncbi:hypothetical protein HMI49_07875 [Corallococcus exercitus]|uniref:Uncharacterized protein n=1 Tax=Corallococcus exercitus TaxID=2316736 RepID=A0A7Y4NQ11_9BACT|nr:hypothetical protein [Corallococcus exercitus]NOK33110.1 hypothetical protein [Corallococcus exercitus]
MFFEDRNGDRFGLRIVGYEFPAGQGAENWLNIEIDAAFSSVEWKAIDPALETFEVASLADWLDALAAGTSTQEALLFIEPNLVFERLAGDGNEVRVRVRVRDELGPRPDVHPSSRTELSADFALDADALRRASRSLREQLQCFPPREESEPED